MNIDQYIEVLQALKEGKIIEVKYIGPNPALNVINRDWHNPIPDGKLRFECIFGPNAFWNSKDYIYRVKPEPVFRPYQNIVEFLSGLKDHGPKLKHHDREITFSPTRIDEYGIGIPYLDLSWQQLLERTIWEDGAICGIQLEEQ